MPRPDSIWLPKAEMKVTVQNGRVYISEEMIMKNTPIEKQKRTGFSS